MAVDNRYAEFNKFQQDFFTSKKRLEDRPDIDFKKHGYVLLSNIGKGFPNFSDILYTLNGIGWKSVESPGLIKAIQKNFLTQFSSSLPQFIYWKSIKAVPKKKVKQTKLGLVFDEETISEICSALMIDSKTYHYLQFTDKIQNAGKQITGDFFTKEKLKTKRKTKKS